jgi:AcrR family transcriptional regulator/DNA-binding MarR family transcriptional regulator
MRILSAMLHVACEEGIQAATVEAVIKRAGVSRKTFYELFEDRGDCLRAALDQTIEIAAQRIGAAFAQEQTWIEQMRAGLHVLLGLLDEDRALAYLFVVESVAAGPALLNRRRELLDQLAHVVDRGRADGRREPLPLAGEAVVGGVLEVLHARLLRAEDLAFVDLLAPLMSFVVLPYLGGRVAYRELHRAPPAANLKPVERTRASNPVDGLPMRLTYRTIQVLSAIADRPGLSNAQISVLAGVPDQGQISRLLSRLARLGLIENTGRGQASGAANAWRLTPRGQEVDAGMRYSIVRERRGSTRQPRLA